MSTRMYFSGTETKRLYECCIRAQAKSFLVSFHYLQSKVPDLLKIRREAFPDHHFFVDSGAYTVLIDADKEEIPVEERNAAKFLQKYGSFESYVELYSDWLSNNRKWFDVAVEFDIEMLVGYGQVLEWAKKYFFPLEKEGVQIIHVWHPARGLDELESMAKRYPYIGVARQEVDNSSIGFDEVDKIARRYLTKIHGFGITSWKQIKSGTFYSVDSTTYLVGQQYGEVCTFRDGVYVRKHWKELLSEPWFKPYIEDELGLDFDLVTAPDLDFEKVIRGKPMTRWEETTTACAYAFARMEQEFSEGQSRPYWEFRLPFTNIVKGMSDEELREWTVRLKMDPSESIAAVRKRAVWVAAIQNGEWDWVSANTSTFVDDYLALAGNSAPSILDKDNYNRARLMLNSKLVPSRALAMARTDSEVQPDLKLEPRGDESVMPSFNRSQAMPVFKRFQ